MKRNEPTFDGTGFSSGLATATARPRTAPDVIPPAQRRGKRRLVTVAGAAVVATALTWGIAAAVDGGGAGAPLPPVPANDQTPEQLLQDWVNRGYIPRQALNDISPR